jgi:hypothetical protein
MVTKQRLARPKYKAVIDESQINWQLFSILVLIARQKEQ